MLAFADDTVIPAKGYKQAQQVLNTLSDLLNRLQLELNVDKTEYMTSGQRIK